MTLNEICDLEESKHEIKEQLEQLRWMDNNYTINIGITIPSHAKRMK